MFTLCHLAEQSTAEVSQALGVSEATVRVHLFRAVRRLRKLLAPAFTPRALSRLQPQIETLVDRLLDRAAARGDIDLIDDFAAAIPIQLIGDLLNLPLDERGPLRDWSLAILGALEPTLSSKQFDTGARAVEEFKAYLRHHIRREAEGGSSGFVVAEVVLVPEEPLRSRQTNPGPPGIV